MDIALSGWFTEQLSETASGFAWAIHQVPVERLYLMPPYSLGEWPASRHAFHLDRYERTIALPTMMQWVGGEMPDGENEDLVWEEGHDVGEFLSSFNEVRNEQIELLSSLGPALWDQVHWTVWGEVPLRWVVTKTYQHTCQHIHDVLSIALFWDMV